MENTENAEISGVHKKGVTKTFSIKAIHIKQDRPGKEAVYINQNYLCVGQYLGT